MIRDLRYAVRMLLRAPAFTAVALLTLALGIGANTAIFSLVDSILLRALPVSHPEQLVLLTDPDALGVSNGASNGRRALLAYTEYVALRDQNSVFSGLLAAESESNRQQVVWTGAGSENGGDAVRTKLVSRNYFAVLGVPAWRGRTFDPSQPVAIGADPVAVLSYGYWTRRFDRDPAVIGRSFTLHGISFTAIGVTPAGFMSESVGQSPDLFFPMEMAMQVDPGLDWLHDPPGVSRIMWLQVMGRLKLGVTLKRAQADCNTIFLRVVQAQAGDATDPASRRGLLDQRLQLSAAATGTSGVRGEFANPLLALFVLVALVLLLAIVNLASMLLARATARQKEVGIRLALGAGRARLVRQLLTESILLAVAGGALGALFAMWGDRLLLSWVARPDEGLALNLHPDWRVLAFTAALCLVSGVLFGLAPALRMARLNLNAALQAQGRGTTAHGRHVLDGWIRGGLPLGKLLVVGQVALSVVLLVGAGLFVRSLRKLSDVPLGFRGGGLLQFGLDTGAAGYKNGRARQLLQTALERISVLPGVASASFSDNGLFSGSECGLPVSVEGYTAPNGQNRVGVRCDSIAPGYFKTAGIPLILGRAIEPQDGSGPKMIDINQTLAQRFFAHRDPIGQKLHDLYPDDLGVDYTIVGVVADSKHNSLSERPQPRIYLPFFNAFPEAPDGANFLVRLDAPPAAVTAPIRRLFNQLDPALPSPTFVMTPELVAASLRGPALLARLSGFFAVLALMLAAIGLYGVMSYGVARRTAEIGVRMALGAQQRAIIVMILSETMVLLVAGLLLGLPVSVAAGRLVASKISLFGVTFYDPATLAATIVCLAAAALLAGYLPARRASRVDPLDALRIE